MHPLHRVRLSPGLPPGSARGCVPEGAGRDTVLLVRDLRGVLHAWRDACPHVPGAPMAWRKDAYLNRDGSRIVCHAHGAQFDPASGECLIGPCLGQRLTPVPFTQTPAGDILLDLAADPQETTS